MRVVRLDQNNKVAKTVKKTNTISKTMLKKIAYSLELSVAAEYTDSSLSLLLVI